MRLLGGIKREGGFGRHDNAELRTIEDKCIVDIVKLQEEVGLRTITDGEYRRQVWLTEFLSSLDGLTMTLKIAPGKGTGFRSDERQGKSKTEDVENVRVEYRVERPIRWVGSANVDAFKFLQSVTKGVPKVTIPAPQDYYFMAGSGRAQIDRQAYPDLSGFWDDMATAYKSEVDALVAAGCTHIQFDDVVNACLCDERHVARLKAEGEDPDALMAAYVKSLNRALAGRPDSLTVSMHICRGNRHGHYIAEGGYDHVADYLFNNLEIDNYYLEYDTPRAGSFEPLRLMPGDKTVVLGLVTTKRAELEPIDALRRRIDQAAKYMPLDRLALSPQCGFSGDMMSDVMSIDQMKRKLALVVETADAVWGSA
jgi:5-methyltetrahydropteroyltriglutamate--homocysteine methyltransferase